MTNTYEIWRDVSNSTLSNLQKILNAVTNTDEPKWNSYKQILTIVSKWNDYEINNVFELFKSLTNSNGSNFTEVLNDIWDSTNSRFYTKTDTSLPFINIDTAKGRAMITTTTAEVEKINIVDDDSGYYLRIGSGIPFNPDYNLCYPQQDLVQALTTSDSITYYDAIGTRSGTQFRGKGFYFNGSDNYIDTGVKVQGGTSIDFECDFEINDLSVYRGLIGCMYSTAGFWLRVQIDGQVLFCCNDGTANAYIYTSFYINVNTKYNILLSWDGLIGTNNVIITLNGTSNIYSALSQWSGNSANTLYIGSVGAGKLNGTLFNYSYTINNQPEVTNYCEQSAVYGTNTILTNTTGTTHTVAGTLTNFFTEDDRKTTSYLNTRGYGTVAGFSGYIPLDSETSQPVITADTTYKGRIKYNVAYDGTYWTYPIVPELIFIDDNEIYYDKTTDPANVTAKSLTIADLPQNDNDKLFWNTDNSTYAKSGLIFDVQKTVAEKNEILTCYVNDGDAEFVNDTNGDPTTDSNGELIIKF